MLSQQMRSAVGGVAPGAAAVLQLLLIDKKLTAAVSEFDFVRHKVAPRTSCFLPERHNAFCSASSVTQKTHIYTQTHTHTSIQHWSFFFFFPTETNVPSHWPLFLSNEQADTHSGVPQTTRVRAHFSTQHLQKNIYPKGGGSAASATARKEPFITRGKAEAGEERGRGGEKDDG